MLFGPDKCHLPIPLSGALHDDLTALKTGVCCPLPHPDASGRQIIWYPMAKSTFEGYTVGSLVRPDAMECKKPSACISDTKPRIFP